MTYTGKQLPAWVRFRAKPKPLPVYTVPTLREHQVAQTINGWREALLGAAMRQNTALMQLPGPLRVMLANEWSASSPK